MVYSLTWLPDVLEAAGLKVAEVNGWRSRGRAEMGRVRGVICHHTAGAKAGNMPTLDLLVRGRPDLGGPLSQLGLGRDGTFYVIAAGRANHAGGGRWRGVTTGNSSFIGIEAENTGKPDDPWPPKQIEALQRGVAAILTHLGEDASMCCGHKEFALPAGRKTDPLFEMAPFRAAVQAFMSGQIAPPPPIPAIDAKSRPTLRRGDDGEVVKLLQGKLGVEPIGHFGPSTEAAVRAFQRARALLGDGIVGPKCWAALDEVGASATPPLASVEVATPIKPIDTTPPVGAGGSAAVASTPTAMPPVDDAAHPVRVQGTKALTPGGAAFAQVFRKGFYTTGRTSLAKWLDDPATIGLGLSDPLQRVVRAMCVNEGGLEAINSYDGCFLSVGIFQWTCGMEAESGELPALLARFKAASPAGWEDCFGRYKLDVKVAPKALTGRLVLDGRPLASPADKAPLREAKWAYRFWRAGHHPDFRAAQLAHAASRIDRFIDLPALGRPIGAWLTSQYGIALVLDEHVNRPGHVPGTLVTALTALLGPNAASHDPASWTDADEHRLIEAYIDAREHTNMTNSTGRARLIGKCVEVGQLSDARGSFARA